MRTVLIHFIAFLAIAGCEITDIDFDTYTINNETNHKIRIYAYDMYTKTGENAQVRDSPVLIDSIIIQPFGRYKVKKRTGEDWQPMGYFKSEADSVVFFFNDLKRLVYVCKYDFCNETRNIIEFRLSSTKTCEENRGCDYTYAITQEDFEKAEIIE